MYFWKCWRDTARWFLAALIFSLAFAALTLFDRGPHSPPSGNALLIILTAWRELGFPLALIACVLGGPSVGSEIGNVWRSGAGEFLLTRPRARRYFVWAGWAVGIAETLAIFVIIVLLVSAVIQPQPGCCFSLSIGGGVHIPRSAIHTTRSRPNRSCSVFTGPATVVGWPVLPGQSPPLPDVPRCSTTVLSKSRVHRLWRSAQNVTGRKLQHNFLQLP